MKIGVFLGILIVVTTALVTTGMQVSASSDSGQYDSTGSWQTVLLAGGEECEGMVFESAEAAEQEALNIGCSGYHEHHQDDGTVVYMPCALEDVDIEDVNTKLMDALARGEITQEQVDEKLAWLEAKVRE